MKFHAILPAAVAVGGVFWASHAVQSQPPFPQSQYYQPLNQNSPPGMPGHWAGALGRADMRYFQPVQITVPGGGDVTFYDTATGRQQTIHTPAQAGMLVGPLYRIRISNMPEFPGVELFPSIEIIDRLHPPPHLKHEYPLPVEITAEDIQQALTEQLVTKIVYIEQPDLAAPVAQENGIREEAIPLNKNLMTEADLRGRPVMYLRLGSRIPSQQELRGNPMMAPAPVEFPAR